MTPVIPSKVSSRILCATLIALPIICAFQIMRAHWVAVPWWDEWLTPGETLASYYRGTLHFADLWSQHNESRKLFPRLLYLALFLPAGWDVRFGMVLTFAWVCAGSAGLYWLLRQCVSRPLAGSGFALMNLLLFSPREYENFLYGIQGETFTPAIALIFALGSNLSAKSFRTKTVINALLAFLSTYTFANGMLIWLLAFPVRWQDDLAVESIGQRRCCRIAYSLAATVSIADYFVGYQHPAHAPPFATLSLLPQVLHYFLTWLGDLFYTSAPALIGLLILSLFILMVRIGITNARRTDSWRTFYPWLMLGGYALISGLVTAFGRLSFGLIAAFDVRYTVFTVFFYIAVIGLFCSTYENAKPNLHLKSLAIVSISLLVAAWLLTFRQELAQLNKITAERRHLRLITSWSMSIPDNPDLQLLAPYPDTTQTIRTLFDHGALRLRPIDARLGQAVQRPPLPAPAAGGYLDEVTFVTSDRLRVHGWARVPHRKSPADCVVLGYSDEAGRWKLFAVTETGMPRPDVAMALQSPPLAPTGFDRTFDINDFPEGSVTFQAWAIDLKRKRAVPISGAITVARPKDKAITLLSQPNIISRDEFRPMLSSLSLSQICRTGSCFRASAR